jgi:hypothetical protein
VDIASSEAKTRRFRLEILLPDDTAESRAIVIDPGETLREQIDVPRRFRDGPVEILLWDQASGGKILYRELRVNLPVPPVAPPIPPTSRR